MNTFTLEGNEYLVEPLAARKQFHILRRLTPILAGLAGAAQGGGADNVEAILSKIGDGLSSLNDEDADYCFFGLLSSVKRKQVGAGWIDVVVENNVMFSDLKMQILLQLVVKSFQANFNDFFSCLPQSIAGK